jgi:hypothetical protein
MSKVLILGIVLVIVPKMAFGQQDKTNLADERITIKMVKRPLGEVFKFLMQNYDVLIGFERSNLDIGKPDYYFETNLSTTVASESTVQDGLKVKISAEHVFLAPNHRITVIAENKQLKKVFDTIVRQMRYYDWEINDGVVNIFPKEGRDLRFKELLETKINSFKFEKGETIWQLTTKIKEMPEIRAFLDDNKLYFSGKRSGLVEILETQYGKTIDAEMNFSSMTFKELLNKITKIKRGGWAIANHGFSKAVQRDYLDIDI